MRRHTRRDEAAERLSYRGYFDRHCQTNRNDGRDLSEIPPPRGGAADRRRQVARNPAQIANVRRGPEKLHRQLSPNASSSGPGGVQPPGLFARRDLVDCRFIGSAGQPVNAPPLRRDARVAEWAGLLIRCTGKPVPRVRIPLSPLHSPIDAAGRLSANARRVVAFRRGVAGGCIWRGFVLKGAGRMRSVVGFPLPTFRRRIPHSDSGRLAFRGRFP